MAGTRMLQTGKEPVTWRYLLISTLWDGTAAKASEAPLSGGYRPAVFLLLQLSSNCQFIF